MATGSRRVFVPKDMEPLRYGNAAWRWLAVRTALAVTAVTAAAPAVTAVAAATPAVTAVSFHPTAAAAQARTTASGDNTGTTVTLVTGDVVTVTDSGSGRYSAAVRSPRRGVFYKISTTSDGHTSVLPSDAMSLVATGKLDPRLFDITTLVHFGYEDAKRKDVPLLAEVADNAPVAKGLTRVRDLPLPRMRTMRVGKHQATAFWRNTVGQPRAAAAGQPAAPPTLTRGVRKLWLDGKMRLSVEQSAPQIGVPAARQAGLTGANVKVAVLDGGYDANHPDLADRVSAAKDFTTEQKGATVDEDGHGTHVASILAGSGAASAGRRQGVAPQAALYVGKVCAMGYCEESAILAGMQWAAEQGVRVVNMSLGCPPYYCPDGNSPLTAAVDRITGATGTLFVVSAGNDYGDWLVSQPATAAAALAVGSVGRTDALSVFSSRGPSIYDGSVKPDLSAPGEGIIAARAAGTGVGQPADEQYARMSGTSMAAPHVAGAAALLAQQHPDWRAERLKAALMSTSRPAAGGVSVYGAGAGVVDLARAVTQQVTAEVGSLSFGELSWPHAGQAPVTRTIGYRNDGDTPVTLTLDLAVTDAQSKPAPAGTFSLDNSVLTIPPHASAQAAVTLDRTRSTGQFGGWATARNADGTVVVRTPLGGYVEEEKYAVTLTVLGRDGQPETDCGVPGVWLTAARRTSTGYENAISGRDQITGTGCPDRNGRISFRAGRGRLSLLAEFHVVDPSVPDEGGNPAPVELAAVSVPDLTVTADTALTLDARRAKPVEAAVPDEPTARRAEGVGFAWVLGDSWSAGGILLPWMRFAAGSIGKPADDLAFYHSSAWDRPQITMRVNGTEIPAARHILGGTLPGDRRLPIVDAGNASPEEIAASNLKGKMVLLRHWSEDITDELLEAAQNAGAAAVVVHVSDPLVIDMTATPLPVICVTSPLDFKVLTQAATAEPATVDIHGEDFTPYRYHLVFGERGQLPNGARYEARRADLARVTSELHHAGDQTLGTTGTSWRVPGWEGFENMHETTMPGRRIDYHSATAAGRQLAWQPVAYPGWSTRGRTPAGFQLSRPATYQAGRSYRSGWFTAPAGVRFTGPSLTNEPWPPPSWAYRSGDTIGVQLALLSGANTDHVGLSADNAGSPSGEGTTVLFKDGREVARNSVPGAAEFTVGPEKADYRLRTDISRPAGNPWWTLSTTVTTEWGFASGHVDGDTPAVLPLLDVDYQIPVDLGNSVPATQTTQICLSVRHQPGTPDTDVRTPTLQVSYDGGRTWRDAAVRAKGATWVATVPAAASANGPRTASLRVTATDSTGASIEETIIDAYALR